MPQTSNKFTNQYRSIKNIDPNLTLNPAKYPVPNDHTLSSLDHCCNPVFHSPSQLGMSGKNTQHATKLKKKKRIRGRKEEMESDREIKRVNNSERLVEERSQRLSASHSLEVGEVRERNAFRDFSHVPHALS